MTATTNDKWQHPHAAVDASAPDLDAAAPILRSPDERAPNRRLLALLAGAVALLLAIAYLMLAQGNKPGARALPHDERVTVAAAPHLALPPRLPPLPPPAATPIPLVAARPLPPLPIATTDTPPAPRAPTLMERRMADPGTVPAPGSFTGDGEPVTLQALPTPAAPAAAQAAAPGLARRIAHAPALMPRGTYIRCVLETRIVSDVPGFASCIVTERVYSFDGSHLLLPQGSKILGAYDQGPVGSRIAIVWDRVITPDGADLSMASPGTDPLGGAGLPGRRDAHWGSRIGSALLISLLSDAFKYEAAKQGPRSTTITNGVVTQEPFESNTARTVQELAGQAVREAANRPPTVTLQQGTIVYVYVARDVDFSAALARR